MYAIIEVGGLQYKVTKDQKLRVPKLDTEAGKKVVFNEVLLVADNDKVTVGKPVVSDTVVKATVLSHGKDKKVLVFKKKRRKGYKVLRGHRQEYTEVKIDKIGSKTQPKGKITEVKSESEPKVKPKTGPKAKPKTKSKAETKAKSAAGKIKTTQRKSTTAAKKTTTKTTKKETK